MVCSDGGKEGGWNEGGGGGGGLNLRRSLNRQLFPRKSWRRGKFYKMFRELTLNRTRVVGGLWNSKPTECMEEGGIEE